MDKDRFRQSLGGLIEAYEEVAHRLALSSTNPRLAARRWPSSSGVSCCSLW
ncbi:hypothetical protein LNQ52_17385 [Klebsiella pneumoniae subsp. pneumoniae]|nr:hypothetical protein [Klebsiella pneumoniae subsp. pneumoniae]